MSLLGRCWRAVLVLGWLSNSLLANAQLPPALAQPVRLTPGRRPLGAVLAELARQSRLPFSYSSSLVPLAHRYQVRPGPGRPAGIVLREVLASEHLTYGLLAGQVVLWPDHAPTPPGVTAVNGEAATASAANPKQARAGTSPSPLASLATPLLPAPGAKLLGPLVATRATGHPAAQRLLSPTPTLRASPASGAGREATAGIKQLAATPKGRLGAKLIYQERAAISPGLRPSYGAHYQGRKPIGGVPGLATPRPVSPLAKTPYPAAAGARSLAQLPLQVVGLQLLQQDALPPVPILGQPVAVGAGNFTDATAPPNPAQHRGPSNGWKGLYLHGEAWASEGLPVGAVAKVGVARAYLVLGVAVALAEHRAGSAWGVGLGTAGRARGRFTPSLDLMHWFLGHDGNDEAGPTYLTQLRPLLAWQLRREGRWALLLGPTLNLATADSHGTQRGNFGRNQWLLVDKGDEHASVRFWPGVQVGLRF